MCDTTTTSALSSCPLPPSLCFLLSAIDCHSPPPTSPTPRPPLRALTICPSVQQWRTASPARVLMPCAPFSCAQSLQRLHPPRRHRAAGHSGPVLAAMLMPMAMVMRSSTAGVRVRRGAQRQMARNREVSLTTGMAALQDQPLMGTSLQMVGVHMCFSVCRGPRQHIPSFICLSVSLSLSVSVCTPFQ